MDFKYNIEIDNDNLDLMDDDMPPCGQTARSESEVLKDTILEVRKLNATRFPLLTLIQRMKFDRENNNFSCLNISFRPNYGNKENFEALKAPVDKCMIEAKEQAYQSIITTLETRVQELNSTIGELLTSGISAIDITSPPGGEARTTLTKEANSINDEYTLKLRTFITDMRNRSRSERVSHRGPTRNKDERNAPSSRNARNGGNTPYTGRRNKQSRNRKSKDNDSKNNDIMSILKELITKQ